MIYLSIIIKYSEGGEGREERDMLDQILSKSPQTFPSKGNKISEF